MHSSGDLAANNWMYRHVWQDPWVWVAERAAWLDELSVLILLIFGSFAVVRPSWRAGVALCLVATVILQADNPHVLNGGDGWLIILYIYATLTPLNINRTYSEIRSWRIAYLVHLACVYGVSGWLKEWDAWVSGGVGVRGVLEMNDVVRTWIICLATWWDRIAVIPSTAVVIFERSVPVLIMLGVYRPKILTYVALMSIVFHVSTALAMQIGLFPLVGIVAWVPVLVWRTEKYPSTDCSKTPLSMRAVVLLRTGALFGVTLGLVVSAAGQLRVINVPPAVQNLISYARLGQGWGMFSPVPRGTALWVSVYGMQESEQPVWGCSSIPNGAEEAFHSLRQRKMWYGAADRSNRHSDAIRRVALMSCNIHKSQVGPVQIQIWESGTDNEGNRWVHRIGVYEEVIDINNKTDYFNIDGKSWQSPKF